MLRSSLGSRLFHWLGASLLLISALLLYVFVLWLPYRGATMRGCPSVCEYPTDCHVAECGSPRMKASCDRELRKCVMGMGGHSVFFSASSMVILTLLGLGWLFIAFYKHKLRLEIHDTGFVFVRMNTPTHVSWESFIGITYHGVTTRLGRAATVYSITGDAGIFSYLIHGLPANTSTRELELGSFLMLHLSPQEHQQILDRIQEQTQQSPEPEKEW